MSAPSEAKPSKAQRTPERAGRSQGSKSASASDGGGRHINAPRLLAGSEAARRRAINRRRRLARIDLMTRSREAEK